MNAVWSLVPLLVGWAADPVPEPEDVRPGWIAFITVALLCAACLLLWFSMRKQIRRIQVPREESPEADAPEVDAPEVDASKSAPEHHEN